jgi:methylmalonyl-CoA mutase C-terminal domain/subunit
MQRKIRVLVGKPGLDGHDRGAKVVAAALRDAGMEVIYTGLHQTPEQVVEAAVQEDVDVVALSILSGAHMTLFPEVLGLMRSHGIGDRLLTGGGIIPAEDMTKLSKMGVGRLFGPGSSTQEIAAYIHKWFDESANGVGAAPAARAARSRAARGAAAKSKTARRSASRKAAPAKRRSTPARKTRGGAARKHR